MTAVVEQEADGMTFGDLLRQKRDERELTQELLASRSGISVNTIRTYEQGQRLPNLTSLVRLSLTLGVTMDDLARCDEVATPEEPPPKARGKRK